MRYGLSVIPRKRTYQRKNVGNLVSVLFGLGRRFVRILSLSLVGWSQGLFGSSRESLALSCIIWERVLELTKKAEGIRRLQYDRFIDSERFEIESARTEKDTNSGDDKISPPIESSFGHEGDYSEGIC